MRIVATALNFMVGFVAGFAVGIFGAPVLGMLSAGVLTSAVIGSFNFFEEKVVEENLKKWQTFFEKTYK